MQAKRERMIIMPHLLGFMAMDAHGTAPAWSLAQAFTFLFVTLGPFNVIGPFVAMTKGRNTVFKRRLAFEAFIIAAIALFIAVTVGANTLKQWSISPGALLLTAGVILFLVALQPVLAGYKPRQPELNPSADAAASSVSDLALSPLAFPTIITPYGIAVLILLATMYPMGVGHLWILGLAAAVLALDLVAMLCADRIARIPFVAPGLGIFLSVMGILQIALSAQAVVEALRVLGIVGSAR